MAQITLKGNAINTNGDLPAKGGAAPDFSLTKTDLSEASLGDYAGKNVVMNIFPSLDTPVCAASVRRFNADASKLDNTVVLCISRDLPFAHKRFCTTEGLDNVESLSQLRDSSFSDDYGVSIVDGPLKGVMARAIVIADGEGNVIHTEQVPEITQEPDYDAALAALG